MPFISVTRLRIRSVRFLPGFALHALRSRRQAGRAAGYRAGAFLADRRRTFWTVTAWDKEESMRRFMTSGPHRTAMPLLLDWCDEASVVHWQQPDDGLPTWSEADERIRAAGRASEMRFPSPLHANLRHDAPRLSRSGPIPPTRS